ncbi:MAG: PDZ domain-containing protein [Acidobacteriota bacterium]
MRSCGTQPRIRAGALVRRLAAALAVFLAGLGLPGAAPGSRGTGTYLYRVDLTGDAVAVTARLPVRESKDFAFLVAPGGHTPEHLRVRDAQGEREVTLDDPEGMVFRVDGLQAGLLEATYQIPLGGDCTTGFCRDSAGILLRAADILIYPVGIDPRLETPCQIDFTIPARWKLITPDGLNDGTIHAGSLAKLGATTLNAGDLTVTRMEEGPLLMTQTTGWETGPGAVQTVLGAYLQEQERLLGEAAGQGPGQAIRVVPVPETGVAEITALPPDLLLLRLSGGLDRRQLAALLVKPFSRLFQQRMEEDLASARSTATLWWRRGFTRYATLLTGLRSGAVPEERFLARLLDAWLNLSSRSPLAGRTSLAAAGALDSEVAREFTADGGLLACFMLDLRIRRRTANSSGIGALLAATRGSTVDNQLLRREASRLGGDDLGNRLGLWLYRPAVPPLADELPLAGLELADAGTGEPFIGLALQENVPVISRVFESGPARARGLRPGDRIIAVNGKPVTRSAQVDEDLARRSPGESVEVTVRTANGQMYQAVLDVWERVQPVLRHAPDAPLAAINAWNRLARGDASAFVN